MIKRRITDEIKVKAKEYEKTITEIDGNYRYNKNNVDGIGHVIVGEYLKEHNIKGRQGKLEGSDKKIDTTTDMLRISIDQLKYYHITFITEQQIDKTTDYYVNIKLDIDLEYSYIIGYISRDEVLSKYPPQLKGKMTKPASMIPIGQFGDFRELIFNETGKLIDKYVKPPKQSLFMDIDVSTLPKNQGKVKNMPLMDYTSEYLASLPNKPKVPQTLMDY